ncbi:kinase suppressor of Ras 1-like isoform X2 [Nomascus leucogenys]|nr:kinase suppressor of Ras 1-like isoform X2 [Nomascus leucogenys]
MGAAAVGSPAFRRRRRGFSLPVRERQTRLPALPASRLGQRRGALLVQLSWLGGSLPRPPSPGLPAWMGEKKESSGGGDAAAAEGGAGAAASRAPAAVRELQKFIGISTGSLRGLRTKCAVSNDLTQQEIRTLE